MARGQIVCTILHIDPLGKPTCIGLNARGTGCGCLVARLSRERAYNILRSGADLSSNSQQLQDIFKEAAGLLLCKRWHQNQWQRIVNKWLNLWKEEEEWNGDSGYSSNNEGGDRSSASNDTDESDEDNYPVSPRAQSRQTVSVGQRQSNVSRMTTNQQPAFETLLSNVVNSNLSADAKVAMLQTILASSSSRSNRTSTTSIQTTNQPRIADATLLRQDNRRSSPHTLSPSPSTITPTSTSLNSSRSVSSPILSSSEARRDSTSNITQAIDARTPTPAPAPIPTRQSQEPTSPTAPLRHSHVECPICMSSYTDGDEEEFFECSSCLNRTHMSCHRQWATIDPRTTTCTFCRAVVPPQL